MNNVTPLYSAFGIVAIESIWPSENGNEVPINYADLSYLRERITQGSTSIESRQADIANEIEQKTIELNEANVALSNYIRDELFNFALNPSEESIENASFFTYYRYTREENTESSDSIIVYNFTPVSVFEGFNESDSSEFLTILQSRYQEVSTIITNITSEEAENLYPDRFNGISGYILNDTITLDGDDVSLGVFEDANIQVEGVGSEDIQSIIGRNLIVHKNLSRVLSNSFSIDVQELQESLNDLENELIDTQYFGTYPQSARRPGFSSILNSEDAYKKRRGYFKILPLNIVSIATSSNISGQVGNSNFNVSFTLDDIILIVDRYEENNIIKNFPTALPITIDTVFDELSSIYNNQIPNEAKNEIVPYGTSAFRVSGNEFTFNIEDIVETNDTVSIWLYHDPKDFDFTISGSPISEIATNRDFSYVIGDGTRKSQDDFNLRDENYVGRFPPKTIAQSILMDSNILSEYTSAEALSTLEDEIPGIELSNSQVFEFLVQTGQSDVFNLANFYQDLGSNQEPNDVVLERTASYIVLDESNNHIRSQIIVPILRQMFFPSINLNSEDVEVESEDVPIVNNNLYRSASNDFILSIEDILREFPENNSAGDLASKWSEKYSGRYVSNSNESVTFESLLNIGIEDFFQGILSYKKTLQQIAIDALNFQKSQNQSNIIQEAGSPSEGHYHKRASITSYSHGETAYLVMKGHISSVKFSYGTSNSSNIVTLSGKGYEKILNENLIYYEDLFSPTGQSYASIEATTIYSQILPPKGILRLIEEHAPRFILIGKDSRQVNDARKMSLYFASASYESNIEDENSEDLEEGQNSEELEKEKNIIDKYFDIEDRSLIRGVAVVDINTSADITSTADRALSEKDSVSLRIFYPVNYINTSRIREMINAMTTSYRANINEAVIKIPITLDSNQSIASNLTKFNGPQEINHLFVDESGRFRQRLAFEALERPPRPEYTPTITDNEIVNSSFSRDGSNVLNMVDIRASVFGTASGLVDARFSGRSLNGGNDYVPVFLLSSEEGFVLKDPSNGEIVYDQEGNPQSGVGNNLSLYDDFYGVISEPFFRYGTRYKPVNDIYTTSTRVAKRKSILYQGFYSKPIKTAEINLKGNPSYRVGETVLLNLNRYKYRSKEIIDIDKTYDWLVYLRDEDPDLIPMYIGVDQRWVNNQFYYLTQSDDSLNRYYPWLSEFKNNPNLFILNQFIKTLGYLKTKLSNNSLKYITPEYFPTTYWYFSGFDYTSTSNVSSYDVVSFYDSLYKILISGGNEVGRNSLESILAKNPSILKHIRMQNFRSTSYHIDSVSHSYAHGEAFSTSLKLNHGQDNITILEPFTMKPIGFMSIERKMRIGYNDEILDQEGNPVWTGNPDYNTKDRLLWEEFGETKSDIQIMYQEQFKEDFLFKERSFLYTSQKYRNTSNFLYELALEIGLE